MKNAGIEPAFFGLVRHAVRASRNDKRSERQFGVRLLGQNHAAEVFLNA